MKKKTLERTKKRMKMHTDEERTRKRGEKRGGPLRRHWHFNEARP
jgi:hypothetical protein